MARPKSNTVDYFTHDVDASTRKTLTIIKGEFGLVGTGFWWGLLENLGNSEGHYFNAQNPIDLEFLVRKIGTDVISGTEILNKLAFLGGIDEVLWDHRVIWSQNFVDRLADVYEKRKRPLPLKPYFCDGNCHHKKLQDTVPVTETAVFGAETPQSIVKETRVEDSRVDKSRVEVGDRGDGGKGETTTTTVVQTKNTNGLELKIYDKFVESMPLAFGRQPDGRELAMIRDFSKQLSAAGCNPALVWDAFKQAHGQEETKWKLPYVRAILCDWLGIERARSP